VTSRGGPPAAAVRQASVLPRPPDSGRPQPPAPWPRRLARRREASALAMLIALLLVFTIMRPAEFATSSNLTSLAQNFSTLLILSVGVTLVTVMGMFDLSIGSVLVFSEVVAARVMGALSQAALLTCIIGLAAAILGGLIWGLINGFLVGRLQLSPFIVTLATFGAALGAAQLLAHGVDLTTIPSRLQQYFGIDKIVGVPTLVIVAAAVAGIVGVILSQTRWGRHTYAIGSNPEAARRASIRVSQHVISVYAVMGMLAGLAGFLSASQYGTTNIGGHTTDALLAITAVALGGASLFGGRGSVAGTVIGVSIPAVLQNGLVILGTQPYWYEIIVGAALVAAIYLDRGRRAIKGGIPR
jgi:ribose transport system permease protein